MKNNQEIQSLIDQLKLYIASEPLMSHCDFEQFSRLSIRLEAEKVELEIIGLGESRFGGHPDVPISFEWPIWIPYSKSPDSSSPQTIPLTFLAQLDLASLPFVDDALPQTGWLYFFYEAVNQPYGSDPMDRGSFRVIYIEANRSELFRREGPAIEVEITNFNACRVKPKLEMSLHNGVPEFGQDTPDYEAYLRVLEKMNQTSKSRLHHLFGLPFEIVDRMELKCQLVTNGVYCGDSTCYYDQRRESLEDGADDWRLLLQLDSDSKNPGWIWGDHGMLYFWIRQDDLKSKNFSNAWLLVQSY